MFCIECTYHNTNKEIQKEKTANNDKKNEEEYPNWVNIAPR